MASRATVKSIRQRNTGISAPYHGSQVRKIDL